ncbi:MAG: DUF1153 domain-containing protein [Rhodospirillales bacterium]|nr:DUF1153 domain-containing protein [Alphaproteobacteria bacterium]USO02943.1 MAG: DUF1153 domain-containing protein [Rhodospirillales bacterium]
MKTKNTNEPNLPPPDIKRWVKSRKLAVVKAIEKGFLSKDEACTRYNLSLEELTSWTKLLERHGPEALRTTHLKQYRAEDLQKQNFQII